MLPRRLLQREADFSRCLRGASRAALKLDDLLTTWPKDTARAEPRQKFLTELTYVHKVVTTLARRLAAMDRAPWWEPRR